MAENSEPPSGKKDWVTYLSQIELPVLAQSLREITSLTDSSTSSVNELAEVILRDADLTSQVIRLSNTVFYNLSHRQVNTVSRAITLIGFETIKSIAISSLLIETLISKSPKDHLLKALAKALHAAVQARSLLARTDSPRREEIFIAALLSHIGEMAFWSCRSSQIDRMSEALNRLPPWEAQDQILGTRFQLITRGIVEKWRLGPLLQEVVSGRTTESDLVMAIRLIVGLVEEAENGWSGPEVKLKTRKLSGLLNLHEKLLNTRLLENSREAANLVSDYGLGDLVRYIPGAEDTEKPLKGVQQSVQNPELQLQILRDLSALLLEKPDLNLILQTVVEGINRALGMPRVALLMLSGRVDRTYSPKLVLGPQAESWKQNFLIQPGGSDFLSQFLLRRPTGLIKKPDSFDWEGYARPAFDRWIGRVPAMFACLSAGNRIIGVIYADGGDVHLPDIEERYAAFCHFCQQAQFALFQLQGGF